MYLKKELYALIQSDESIFDFIQESSLDGLCYLDLENPENGWMNAKFWNVLGYNPDEMPHKSAAWQSIINQDDLKVANDNFTKHCNDSNHPYDQVVRYTHKDGSTVYFRCRGLAIRNKDGKPIRMLGAHQDVTELKRREQELYKANEKLLESKEKNYSFYNNAPLSFQSLDENGCFLDINPMWLRTLGYKRDEVIGKWYGDFLHPDYVEHFRINFPAFKKLGCISDVQFRLRRKDNTYIYVSFEGCIGYTPEGKFKQTYCVFKDITEQKALENAIIKAKEKAEESDRLKSAFLSNMSHEIRTPMNGILGFASLLKEPGLTGDVQHEYIKLIEKSGARMLNIIKDIVDISKIESGIIDIHLSETNINNQLQFVYDSLKFDADNKKLNLSFNCALPEKEVIIKTDIEKLYGILTNLVKNAIKYTDTGTIEFGFNNKDKVFEFYVTDTGIGIPKEKHEAIFERFIQANIVDKMARQGAGLGLAISRAYVEMLGGKIWVESDEGKGSTFYFTLPNSTQLTTETINRQPAPSEKINDVRKLKILIAEDDEVSEMLIGIIIRSFGYDVLKARTGVEAIEVCRNNPDIDLILMDIRMPDMGGYAATKQIRKFNKEVIIIAQTVYGLSGDREKSIESGCNDYIAKPIVKDKLLSLIRKYFKKELTLS